MSTGTHVVYDPVTLPKHYQLTNGKEVLDYVLAITNALPVEVSYALGNAFKYIGRAPRKEHLEEDLSKSMYYSKDAKARESVGLDLKSYKKHLKTINLDTLERDVTDFGYLVADTYPKELGELVSNAIYVWADFFYDVSSSKGRIKLTEAQLSYAIHDWVVALAKLNEASRRYLASK